MERIVPHVSNILALKEWRPFHSTELYDGYLIAVLHWAAEGGTDLHFYWNMEKQKKKNLQPKELTTLIQQATTALLLH